MKKIFTDKDGVNPEWEGFREGSHTETRPFVEVSDGTDLTNKIIEGGVLRDLTAEEIVGITQAEMLATFKANRPALVQVIKVTVDGMEFDGDEISQTRMSRAIVVMDDFEVVTWTLADNTYEIVTKAQLTQALKLAGLAQTALWMP